MIDALNLAPIKLLALNLLNSTSKIIKKNKGLYTLGLMPLNTQIMLKPYIALNIHKYLCVHTLTQT